jgi:hypothetical protein
MTTKITEEKINLIIKLRKLGNTYDNICKIVKSSKKTVRKVCGNIENNFTYPSIIIPENMKETQYPGYYITEDGKAYRKPRKNDKYGYYGNPNENGLIYLKPGYRGSTKNKNYYYDCINISLYDENGKFLKQIKKSIHQLVAETFIPNPNNYTEIDHIDRNKRNNSKDNLRWVTRSENMNNR